MTYVFGNLIMSCQNIFLFISDILDIICVIQYVLLIHVVQLSLTMLNEDSSIRAYLNGLWENRKQ